MDLDDLTVDNTYQLGGSDDERERAKNAALIEELDRKKKFRKMAVPTDDKKVRERLRAYGEPMTLFGEGPGDRRDRLKYVQEQIEQARGGGGDGMDVDGDSDESSDSEEEEEFYTEGSDDLLEARRKLARYSLSKARTRIARQRVEVGLPLGKIVSLRKEVFSELKTFNNLGSQFGDDRPLSTIRFSPNSQYILTTSWTGDTKIWDLPNLNPVSTKKGHLDKIGGAAWHPQATLPGGIGEDGVNFATGGGEGSVKLWSMSGDKPIATLTGHENRVGRVAFHPSGSYLGSAGFDGTWRLWDVEKQKELLTQEGHSKEVYALAFQDDGALVSSGGFDAIGRVWDIRTGRTAMVLDGHIKEILAMDFAPNGYQVATGSGDDTVRIWDLRALKTQYMIPAHKSSVSDVRFFKSSSEISSIGINGDLPLSGTVKGGVTDSTLMEVDQDKSDDNDNVVQEEEEDVKPNINGNANGSTSTSTGTRTEPIEGLNRSGLFLITSGFDCNVRIWSSDEWSLIKNLPTDSGKVMSVDISSDSKFIASASYSRSFHLFGGDKSL
uniref:U4/U6 small nuclear ribonucleoprotein PRP4 n=1 Tax=Kwoniella dejecticola CBS 10117 TaxID=1296121 RepID=A0A1A6AD22_9TREE|nr:U4/U6 small nuclear ribonucleoprotein PRP4 [Kwoniella dejecticola CBS 10117]OBR87956.1 U4/U6 small nuclear ribonucleoprotein PRP4 [Kwoniella dejecticola CBS 10117]